MKLLRTLLLWLILLGAIVPLRAQPPSASNVTEIIDHLKTTSPKLLILVLDTSNSMKEGDFNTTVRKAAESLVNDACVDGDRVALFTFGAGFKQVFDEPLTNPAARRKVLERITGKIEPGEGTNIRKAHHEALKLAKSYVDTDRGTPALVLLTDSFNDPPKNTPAAMEEYTRYYTMGKLDVYPKTPENTEYESLLQWMTDQGYPTYGIGVTIQPSGRPLERFKTAVDTTIPATPEPTPEPSSSSSTRKPEPESSTGLYAALIGGAALLGGLFFVFGRSKPLPLRISGPGGARDFDVRGNTTIRLGGDGVAGSLDGYPVPGVKETAATIRAAGGGLQVQAQPGSTVRVYHNGMVLEKATTLRYGDELRLTLPDPNGGVPREFRLKFSHPNKEF